MELKDQQYFSRMLRMVSFFLFQPEYSVNYQTKQFFCIAKCLFITIMDISHISPRGDQLVLVASVESMSVSEQLGTYPSLNPTKSQLISCQVQCWVRGGEGLGAVAQILKLISSALGSQRGSLAKWLLEFPGIPRNKGVNFHGKFGLGTPRNSQP